MAEVILLDYHHRKRGLDAFVCATYQDADRTMAQLMLDNLSESIHEEGLARQIVEALKDHDYGRAAGLWGEFTGGNEHFETSSVPLLENVKGPKISLEELFGLEV